MSSQLRGVNFETAKVEGPLRRIYIYYTIYFVRDQLCGARLEQ